MKSASPVTNMSCWHQDRKTGLDAMLNAVKHRLAFAFLYTEELIKLVDFRPDIFTGLKAHHDELAMLRRIQDRAERLVLLRRLFDVVDVTLHSFLGEDRCRSFSVSDGRE